VSLIDFPIVCIAVGVERPAARGFKRKKEKRLAGKKEKIKSKPERNFKLQQFGADRTKHQNFEEEEEEEAFKGKKKDQPSDQPTSQPTQIECVSMLSCYTVLVIRSGQQTLRPSQHQRIAVKSQSSTSAANNRGL
jgi:hypothetical protein